MDFEKIIIPPLSAVTFEVMRFNPDDDNADSSKLERMIKPDEGICSEILRVSNSSFYGRSGRVQSLKDGITLIGLKSSRNLIILLTTRAMSAGLKGETFTRHLNEFSITCAIVAAQLCESLQLKQYKEEAFIGGLLHKIGMTVFALNKRNEYAELLQEVEKNFADLSEVEKSRFSLDHVEVGRRVMSNWKMPEQYQDVIANHAFDVEDMGEVSDLVKITSLASLTSREMMGILLPMNHLEKKAKLTSHFNVEDTIQEFNKDYFEKKIKSHSFYKVAVG